MRLLALVLGLAIMPMGWADPYHGMQESQIDLNCMEMLRSQIKYPQSLRITGLRDGLDPKGNYARIYSFEAKNGFGNTLPQRAQCTVTPKKKMNLVIGR